MPKQKSPHALALGRLGGRATSAAKRASARYQRANVLPSTWVDEVQPRGDQGRTAQDT